ncbi:glycosyltransferase [Chryseolinea lacunae]|uniref:Glycosyltransferase n=1 Tax=Chryseolinea lacunae TaxID=2801331 RepID=A0ABS1KTD7_9BACT|nr:glycosyltransferase [Chryseolinea lacunae]MBL0742453.1 glycosyltransferase [Chryseolinea lacunae]
MVEGELLMKNKPNVLYLSYDGLTDPLGQSQILPYVIGLSEHYTFTIISFEKDERFASGRKGIQALCDQHNIRWVPLRYHKTPPVFSTLYDVWKLRRTSAALHKTNDFKIVHCRSYITALVGLWMKRTLGVKFIFDMRGFWADERVDGGLWNLKNPFFKIIYRFFKRKEKEFIREANAVISLTKNAKEEMLQWNLTSTIDVIPCCVDLEHFRIKEGNVKQKEILRAKLGIGDDDFVLLYLGSLGTWYLSDEMLLFFSTLKNKIPNAKFLLISPDALDLTDYIYKEDVIARQATRQEVPNYIQLADASVIFISPTFSKKASSATKMAEVMAMGIPVVANGGWGDVEEIITDLNAGVLLEKFEAAHYAQAVDALVAFRAKKSQPFHERVKDSFSLEGGIERYLAVYRKL